jgi:thiosulfate/3-mercaptopyruvate sulfurtransferase
VWLLELLGNKKGRLLDGGLNLWKREGRALSSEDPKYDRAKFILKLEESQLCTLEALQGHVRMKDATVIDVRNPGEFSGKYRRALKLGHVPGSSVATAPSRTPASFAGSMKASLPTRRW